MMSDTDVCQPRFDAVNCSHGALMMSDTDVCQLLSGSVEDVRHQCPVSCRQGVSMMSGTDVLCKL